MNFMPGDKVQCVEPVAVLGMNQTYTVQDTETVIDVPSIRVMEIGGGWRASRFIKVKEAKHD